jgi:hypothetical protein
MDTCHACNKPIQLPNKKVSISLSESSERTSFRIGVLFFHADCFYGVAGNEYKQALTQNVLCFEGDPLQMEGMVVDWYKRQMQQIQLEQDKIIMKHLREAANRPLRKPDGS